MQAIGTQYIRDAWLTGYAVAAISTYTLESTRAICSAAESVGVPVIVQAGSSSFEGVGREMLAAAVRVAADESSVPVGVHLDHSTDLDEIRACIDLGYSSVMFDGSNLPFQQNIALTAEVVAMAHEHGVWVEGELGVIAGDENASSSSRGRAELTDVAQAERFVRETGVDLLAVSVGNVHGINTVTATLDLTRLAELADAVPVPLVLHGASGVENDVLLAAVARGVAKININTELRRAYLGALRAEISPDAERDNVVSVQKAAITAMRLVAEEKIRLLAGV